ncbi:MAG TPA: SHOCT domain-containing protein [Propionibacteriaceae bacterium]|nr:SHOCT domain-containing protein [Propionibacteriaceae bacterium]
MLDQLQQLGELKSAGVLTEAEFQAQKARIMAGS